jgi:predicted ATPase
VLPTVARALGVAEARDQPLAGTLIDALRMKALLLVLDNCEQVSAAGPALLPMLGTSRCS